MNEETNALKIAGEVLQETQLDSLEVGKWIGRVQMANIIANQTMAAQAQMLKRIKDSAPHKALNLTWDQFCDQQICIPRRTVDRIITQFEEFGAAYFALSSVVRISADKYRMIAGAVDGDTIEIEGEKVAITKQNANRIAQAIAEMTKQLEQERDQARGQLSDTKAAHDKLKIEAANNRKAAEKSRDELQALKRKETELFPNATPRERQLLLAQTRIQDAVRLIHAVAVDPDITADEQDMLNALGNLGIKLIGEATGANPWEDFQMSQITARDLINEHLNKNKGDKK